MKLEQQVNWMRNEAQTTRQQRNKKKKKANEKHNEMPYFFESSICIVLLWLWQNQLLDFCFGRTAWADCDHFATNSRRIINFASHSSSVWSVAVCTLHSCAFMCVCQQTDCTYHVRSKTITATRINLFAHSCRCTRHLFIILFWRNE